MTTRTVTASLALALCVLAPVTAQDAALTPDFMKKHDMTWTAVFSDEPVFNPAYGVRGIPTMVIIAPDGTVRHSSHPMQVNTGMIDAILKEFKLPVTAAKKA